MSYPALSSTTLGAAVAGNTQSPIPITRIAVASSTGMSAGSSTAAATVLVVGNEAMTVVNVVNTTTVEVERGTNGSAVSAHASGAIVYFGNSSSSIGNLATSTPSVFNLGAAQSTAGIPQFSTVVGMKKMDPNTGYVYQLVDCQNALFDGEWSVIDGTALASSLAAGSKGRVGIVVETVAASDTLSWVLREGTYSSATFTSDVTTACILKAGTSQPDILTSTDGNVIYGATCTAAPSTATTTILGGVGTAYIENPWCFGVNVGFAS